MAKDQDRLRTQRDRPQSSDAITADEFDALQRETQAMLNGAVKPTPMTPMSVADAYGTVAVGTRAEDPRARRRNKRFAWAIITVLWIIPLILFGIGKLTSSI